jgi:hypothetical protein
MRPPQDWGRDSGNHVSPCRPDVGRSLPNLPRLVSEAQVQVQVQPPAGKRPVLGPGPTPFPRATTGQPSTCPFRQSFLTFHAQQIGERVSAA